MKINSKELFNYINELPTGKKVKFAVYYDDNYIAEVKWDGKNFNLESGMFTSGAFFSPLYDFKILNETDDEFEDIEEIEQQDFAYDLTEDSKCECLREYYQQCEETINQLIRNQKNIIDKLKKLEKDE